MRPTNSLEFGLFWMIDPAHQHKGYAKEAAQAMIDMPLPHSSWRV